MTPEKKAPRSRSDTIESRVAIKSHPLHPMLVVYPVSFLSMLLVTDGLYLWLNNPFWAQVSWWLNLAGLCIGLVAGLAGAADMFAIRWVRRHISAWSHFIAAVMLLALAAAGVWVRWPDPVAAIWPWGLVLSSLTFGLVMVVGWLGGTLSFRHGVGVFGEKERADADLPPGE